MLDSQVLTCLFFTSAHLFEALAAPVRRAILDELCDREGQTLLAICTRLTMKHSLPLTRQAILQHLEVLDAAGLVSTGLLHELLQQRGRHRTRHPAGRGV